MFFVSDYISNTQYGSIFLKVGGGTGEIVKSNRNCSLCCSCVHPISPVTMITEPVRLSDLGKRLGNRSRSQREWYIFTTYSKRLMQLWLSQIKVTPVNEDIITCECLGENPEKDQGVGQNNFSHARRFVFF